MRALTLGLVLLPLLALGEVEPELGHTLGMPHCESVGCVMADAKGNAIKSADHSTGQYCEPCRKLAPEGSLK